MLLLLLSVVVTLGAIYLEVCCYTQVWVAFSWLCVYLSGQVGAL